jgi:hypothetical protein
MVLEVLEIFVLALASLLPTVLPGLPTELGNHSADVLPERRLGRSAHFRYHFAQ